MGKFLIGLIIGILLIPAGFYLYLRSGRAPVAASAPPMPFEHFFVQTAMHATIRPQEPKTTPGAPSENVLVAGAHTYNQNCAVCHGLPGKPPTAAAKGMYPQPPQFFWPHATRIDDPVGEIYWKVKNGVRLTGMPGFQSSLSEEQIWQVSQLVANTVSLPAAATAALQPAPLNAPQPKPASTSHAHSRHKTVLHS